MHEYAHTVLFGEVKALAQAMKDKPVTAKKRAVTKTGKKRQRLPAAERREQVLGAAQRVFIRQGFHGTRTRDLADEAGVNEATLFLYFDSKQEIFEAAITEPLRALVKLEMEKGMAFASAATLETKAMAGAEGIRGIYEAMVGLSPLVIAALFADREKGKEIYKKDIYPMIRKLRGASKLSFNVKDDDEAEFITMAAFGLCFTLHMSSQLLDRTADVDMISERIAKLFLQGALRK